MSILYMGLKILAMFGGSAVVIKIAYEFFTAR